MTTRRPPDPTVLSGASLPHALRDLPTPPEEAYLWGRLPPGPRIGLVGTRQPSARGFRIAFETARRLAALGATIVSGGAWGIDRAAHLGALRSLTPTLVVAPVWLERAYPDKNLLLFDKVIERGGGYLTVSPPTAVPFYPTFRRRNEILVALCDVLLLGEIGIPSGALIAAGFARRLGCPRLVLPWYSGAPDTRGIESELGRGAGGYFRLSQLVRLLEGRRFENPLYWERSARLLAAEAAEEAARRRRSARAKRPSLAPLSSAPTSSVPASPRGDAVFDAIASGLTTLDALVDQTGLSAAVVQHRVLRLTLEGAVLRDAGGLLRIAPGCKAPLR